MRRFLIFSVLLVFATVPLVGQDDGDEGKDRESAFVRIINASTVILKEPWKSGVDLAFKDQKLAIDIRGGEAANYRQITFTGKDTVEARATGQARILGAIPANFEKGGFYSIYLTGLVTETGFNVSPLVLKDFPIPAASVRKGFARVKIFNSVSTFAVKLQLDGGPSTTLPSLGFTEVFLTPGSHPYRLLFPYKSSERDMQGFLRVDADADFSAIVCASPEKPDRPILRFLDNTTAKRDVEEALEAEKKEKAAANEAGTGNAP